MSVKLSREPCYAGFKQIELLDLNEDFFWFQVVEGCGYDSMRMTTQEARAVAQELNEMADKLESREHLREDHPAQPVSQPGAINIIFDGPPSNESGRFIESENDAGESICAGTWINRGDGTWALRIER